MEEPMTSRNKSATLMLRGVSISYTLVQELATMLWDRELAGRLEHAVENETRLLAIDDEEVDSILHVLTDVPAGLEALRGVLLREHVGRLKDGLA
jgi:hypothetical protein